MGYLEKTALYGWCLLCAEEGRAVHASHSQEREAGQFGRWYYCWKCRKHGILAEGDFIILPKGEQPEVKEKKNV